MDNSKPKLISVRFDLPFYLRLPSAGFLAYDEKYGFCTILPMQRLGESGFKRKTKLFNTTLLLDDIKENLPMPPYHDEKWFVTSVIPEIGEIKTLHIDADKEGGFSQLRAYSEVVIFCYVGNDEDPFSVPVKQRIFNNFNNFIDIYRIVTQDPYVFKIYFEKHLYLVDMAIGEIPDVLLNNNVRDILLSVDQVVFAREIGKNRAATLKVDSLEDLHPGKILANDFLRIFTDLIKNKYEMPLFDELILEAQHQVKLKNYHMAIIEAETAFETYVAILLRKILLFNRETKTKIRQMFEDRKKLGLLNQRINKLDELIKKYRISKKETDSPFVGSIYHSDWKSSLYEIRNKVVHEGFRNINYDMTIKGILSAKEAIKFYNERVSDFKEPIQMFTSLAHITNTPGKLFF